MRKKQQTTKQTTNFEDKVPVGPDAFTAVLSKDELTTLIQILAFSREMFAQMALNLLKEGNEADSKIISARSLLSEALCSKFKDIAIVGEPESRQVH